MSRKKNKVVQLGHSKRDFIALGAVTAVSVIAVAGAWAQSPIRQVEHQAAAEKFTAPAALSNVPDRLSEKVRYDDTSAPGVHQPLVVGGVIATSDGHGVVGHSPDGTELWKYSRDKEICSLAQAWNHVVVTYRNGAGCGDVVSLNAANGSYAATRSAINDDNVVPVSSNDRVGTVGPTRTELWRNDMVRTVEYGHVEDPQEPNMQPHGNCEITSAMTRTELFAVTEVCPDDKNITLLHFQKTTPSDNRKPELSHDVKLPSPDARVVSIGQKSAAVYLPGQQAAILSLDSEGKETGRHLIDPAPAYQGVPGPVAPNSADLPHHMTWFDGKKLYLLAPENMTVKQEFADAIGTGTAVGDRLVYPTKQGLAVANWDTGQVERVIPVDRGGYNGDVNVTTAGALLVEKRGSTVVGLG